jgi:hypothetical protein
MRSNLMRYPFLLLFSCFISCCFGQLAVVGYAITLEGDTILFHHKPSEKEEAAKLTMTAASVDYVDAEGKTRSLKQADLREMRFGGHRFMNLPIYSMGMDRMQRVVMENDRYILTSYFGNLWTFYIFNKRSMEAEEKKMNHSFKPKSDLKSLDKVISRYFGDCNEAMTAIRDQISTTDYRKNAQNGWDSMFGSVSNYICQ